MSKYDGMSRAQIAVFMQRFGRAKGNIENAVLDGMYIAFTAKEHNQLLERGDNSHILETYERLHREHERANVAWSKAYDREVGIERKEKGDLE